MGQFEVLKKIQEIELDALKEFNKICKENNLMFFLRGGSVMGAVKYQGFIPWDDDVGVISRVFRRSANWEKPSY